MTESNQVEVKDFIMVSIRCTVYNHEPYLRQCLEGFVMQKTNFRFEAIIHDDASTDGSAAIIREFEERYPDIIKPIYETENQWSKHDGSLARIMNENTHGKYVAICEGDDYWIDPLKLQKQVDFMEVHTECSLVHTAFRCVDKDSNFIIRPFYEQCMKRSKSGIQFFELLFKGNYIMTLTVMVRTHILMTKPPYYYDYGLFIYAARQGMIGYLHDATACYRNNPNSLINTPNINNYFNDINQKIFLKEIEAVYSDCQTMKIIKEQPNYSFQLGVFLWYKMKQNKLYRKKYLKLVYRHPSLWYSFIRSAITNLVK